jgi:hypothetical protein
MSTFAAKSGRGLLLAAINAVALGGVSFVDEDLVFVAPTVVVGETYDTKVVYSAPARYEGDAEAHFDRLDLEGIFTAAGVTEVKVRAEAVTGTSTSDVVAALNARYGLQFDETDIVAEEFAPGSESVILKAADGSFAFAGQVIVELSVAAIALADMVNPELGNLVAPVPVDSETAPA